MVYETEYTTKDGKTTVKGTEASASSKPKETDKKSKKEGDPA